MDKKQQQIEEMAKILQKDFCEGYEHNRGCCSSRLSNINCIDCKKVFKEETESFAEKLYAAGYRKQSDVVREFAEQAKERLSTLFGTDKNGFIIPTDYNGAVERCICEIINLAAEFGAEVEDENKLI